MCASMGLIVGNGFRIWMGMGILSRQMNLLYNTYRHYLRQHICEESRMNSFLWEIFIKLLLIYGNFFWKSRFYGVDRSNCIHPSIHPLMCVCHRFVWENENIQRKMFERWHGLYVIGCGWRWRHNLRTNPLAALAFLAFKQIALSMWQLRWRCQCRTNRKQRFG